MLELSTDRTVIECCIFLLAGGAGGLVRHLLSKGGLILPSRQKVGDEVLLRMGFLASMMIGAAVGLLVDSHWLTAFGWGISGPYTLEKLGQIALNGKKS